MVVAGFSVHLIYAAGAFFTGGILKGATGAGAPIIAIPILTFLFDVPTAVASFTLPNLLSNLWQGWHFRKSQTTGSFAWIYGFAGLLGVVIGTVGLAHLPQALLSLMLSGVVVAYLIFRRFNQTWALSLKAARRFGPFAGLVGGLLQGAAGVSAPVSVTFLNAMKLPRATFIAVISVFFVSMSIVQVPMLIGFGILTGPLLGLSLVGTALVFAGMPIGAWLAKRLNASRFDLLIQAVLGLMALGLIVKSLGPASDLW